MGLKNEFRLDVLKAGILDFDQAVAEARCLKKVTLLMERKSTAARELMRRKPAALEKSGLGDLHWNVEKLASLMGELATMMATARNT